MLEPGIQERFYAIESLFAVVDNEWRNPRHQMQYKEAKRRAVVIDECVKACIAQLERADVALNLVSTVWNQGSLDIYADRVKVFTVTWGEDGSDFVAQAEPTRSASPISSASLTVEAKS